MHLQLHLKLQVMSLKQKQQYAYGLNVCEMLSDYFLSRGGGDCCNISMKPERFLLLYYNDLMHF